MTILSWFSDNIRLTLFLGNTVSENTGYPLTSFLSSCYRLLISVRLKSLTPLTACRPNLPKYAQWFTQAWVPPVKLLLRKQRTTLGQCVECVRWVQLRTCPSWDRRLTAELQSLHTVHESKHSEGTLSQVVSVIVPELIHYKPCCSFALVRYWKISRSMCPGESLRANTLNSELRLLANVS